MSMNEKKEGVVRWRVKFPVLAGAAAREFDTRAEAERYVKANMLGDATIKRVRIIEEPEPARYEARDDGDGTWLLYQGGTLAYIFPASYPRGPEAAARAEAARLNALDAGQ
jgi:hypothetical protein